MGTVAWPYELALWTRRLPLILQGTASAGPYATIVVPKSDDLWGDGGMQADGDDLRTVVGRTNALVDYNNGAPDTAARTIATFLIEAADIVSADYSYIYWLYWGNSAAANAEGTVTNTTSVACTEGYGSPDPASTVACVPDAPGATTPSQRISKITTEEKILWWELTPALGEAEGIAGKPASRYLPWRVFWNATTGSGLYSASGATREATYTDQAESLIVEVGGRLFYGMHLQAAVGSSGSNYLAKLVIDLVDTASGSFVTREFRALVQALNPV